MTIVDWMFEHPYLATWLGTVACCAIGSWSINIGNTIQSVANKNKAKGENQNE